jgi:hypothetical protein
MNTKMAFFLSIPFFVGAAIMICGGNGEDTAYQLGDTGPGSGKIFYVSRSGFTVHMANPAENYTAHYLEVATREEREHFQQLRSWATSKITEHPELGIGISGYDHMPIISDVQGTETGIGAGRRNTDLITATDMGTETAAYICRHASYGGKTDWFLPSKDELDELYKNKEVVGLFVASLSNPYVRAIWSSYWSSSQSPQVEKIEEKDYRMDPADRASYANSVWVQDFSNGNQHMSPKIPYWTDTSFVYPVRAF